MAFHMTASLRKFISLLLLVPFFTASVSVTAWARAEETGKYRVLNQEVRIEGTVAYIAYDLEAPVGESYSVELTLHREKLPTYEFKPVAVTGDIGKVNATGRRLNIQWDFAKDFPQGLLGEDYYFSISVNEPGGFPWLWVGAGAAAAAGALVALLSKSKGQSTVIEPPPPTIPYPPSR